MNIWESVRLAAEGVWHNKMRSALTMLGIIIGIASVIFVVAIGRGGQYFLENKVSELLGVNVFRVYVNVQDGEVKNDNDFALTDVEVIRELVPGLSGLSAVNETYTAVKGPRDRKTVGVMGGDAGYQELQNLKIISGRLFTETDVNARRPVILIDDLTAQEIFGSRNPLGEKVTISGSRLVVIGVIESKRSFLNGNRSLLYMPVTTWQDVFNSGEIAYLEGQAADKEKISENMDRTVAVMERRHRTEDHYMGAALEQEMEQINQITAGMTLVVGAIAGISLLVGGIGVMNIMLVSVTERTREIGIRKALGAGRRDIMLQFLIESLVLCILGGLIGMTLGIGGTLLISLLVKMPPLVSWTTVMVAVLFSSAVGIFFGLYPANKAAKLEPVEALRFE